MVRIPLPIDFYALEEKWTLQKNFYSEVPEGDPFKVAKEIYEKIKYKEVVLYINNMHNFFNI